jgi:hypothetical protein
MVHTGFYWGNLRGGYHLENAGVDGKVILRWISDKWGGGGGADWINLAEDRWWALVNVVVDIQIS